MTTPSYESLTNLLHSLVSIGHPILQFQSSQASTPTDISMPAWPKTKLLYLIFHPLLLRTGKDRYPGNSPLFHSLIIIFANFPHFQYWPAGTHSHNRCYLIGG